MKSILYTIEQRARWDEFVAANASDGGLCQSWLWGELQERLGHSVLRQAVEHDGELVAVAQGIVTSLPLGQRYLYIPRGPVIATASELVLFPQLQIAAPILDVIMKGWQELARQQGLVFVRTDPAWHDDSASVKLLAQRGWRRYGQVQPRETLIIALTQSDEQLLAGMKSKARYNITLARKHGVEIASGQQYRDDVLRLLKQTGERANITLHGDRHYRALIELLYQHTAGEVHVARHNGTSIAAMIVAYFGTSAYYLHGGSDYEARALMAPHLMQYEAMRRARERGCHTYDLWGIDEQKWSGVTRFKRSLAPDLASVVYLGNFDRVYSPARYLAYRALRSLMK